MLFLAVLVVRTFPLLFSGIKPLKTTNPKNHLQRAGKGKNHQPSEKPPRLERGSRGGEDAAHERGDLR